MQRFVVVASAGGGGGGGVGIVMPLNNMTVTAFSLVCGVWLWWSLWIVAGFRMLPFRFGGRDLPSSLWPKEREHQDVNRREVLVLIKLLDGMIWWAGPSSSYG